MDVLNMFLAAMFLIGMVVGTWSRFNFENSPSWARAHWAQSEKWAATIVLLCSTILSIRVLFFYD